jgi:hypothetical protein
VQRVENEQGWTVQFQATATDGSPENKTFFAPPSQSSAGGGQVNVAMVAPDVAAQFKPGKSYTFEISEVTS